MEGAYNTWLGGVYSGGQRRIGARRQGKAAIRAGVNDENVAGFVVGFLPHGTHRFSKVSSSYLGSAVEIALASTINSGARPIFILCRIFRTALAAKLEPEIVLGIAHHEEHVTMTGMLIGIRSDQHETLR